MAEALASARSRAAISARTARSRVARAIWRWARLYR